MVHKYPYKRLLFIPADMATTLIFPNNLSTYSFWMSLDFYQYRIPTTAGFSAPNAVLSLLGTIHLPLPNTLTDHQDIIFSQEELGLAAGAALAKFQQTGSLGQALGTGVVGAIQQGATQLGNAIVPGGTAGAANIFLQTQGLATNPFLTIMFKSPAFKKHLLRWKLTPANQAESLNLNAINNMIRFNQLPSATAGFGGTLLAYPNIVLPSINGASTLANAPGSLWTFQFNPAVIESHSTNWAPDGQPSFFYNGAPTAAEITLSLLEIQYFLQGDYSQGVTTAGAQNVQNAINGGNQALQDIIAKFMTPTTTTTTPTGTPGVGNTPAPFTPPPFNGT